MYLEKKIQAYFHAHQSLQMEQLRVFEVENSNDQCFKKIKTTEGIPLDSLHNALLCP